jgi:hypothetical protein
MTATNGSSCSGNTFSWPGTVVQRTNAEINLPFQQLRHQRIIGLIVKLHPKARKSLRERPGSKGNSSELTEGISPIRTVPSPPA